MISHSNVDSAVAQRREQAPPPGHGRATPPRHGRRRPTIHAFPHNDQRRGSQARAPHDGSAGFTLLETIVVIAVLGLALAVVAGFAPRRHAALDLSNAADAVAESLRNAQARAIASQHDVTIAVTQQGHAYAVDAEEKPLPADVTLQAAAPVRFAPDGSSSGGALRLGNGTQARLLRIDWLTGQVSVTDAQ